MSWKLGQKEATIIDLQSAGVLKPDEIVPFMPLSIAAGTIPDDPFATDILAVHYTVTIYYDNDERSAATSGLALAPKEKLGEHYYDEDEPCNVRQSELTEANELNIEALRGWRLRGGIRGPGFSDFQSGVGA